MKLKETKGLAKNAKESAQGKKPVKLVPPDPNRCQRTFPEGCWPDAEHFMVIGPARLRRCDRKPVVIVVENKPTVEGQCGSMSLCSDCLQEFIQTFGQGYATVREISQKRAGKQPKND